MLLTLMGKAQTRQDTGRARFGLVGFHLGQFLVNVAQRDIETFSFVVESRCIRRGVCHGGSFGFDGGEFFGDFLKKKKKKCQEESFV